MKIHSVFLFVLILSAPAFADDKPDVQALIKQLQDKDEVVRLKAAKTLEKLGADAKDALPALNDATNDPDDDVKSVAKRAVVKIREALARSDKEAAKALLASLEKDAQSNDKDTQAAAVAGLAKLLKNDDELIRAEAARSLGEAGAAAKSAMKELDQAAKDPDPTVRKEARKTLDGLQALAAADAKAAIQEKLAPLVKDLKDPKPAVKAKALEGLADMGPDAADASEAILALLADRSPAMQQAAMDALEKVNPSLHKPILTLLVDRFAPNKSNAIIRLSKMGADAKPAMPTLLRFYQIQLVAGDGSTSVRAGGYSYTLLTAMNSRDPDNAEFQNAILAHVSADAVYIPILSDLVKNNHLDAAKAVKPLRQALAERTCRLQAIMALGDLGPTAKDALPELKQLKNDSDQATRDAADDAVKKIE
jgi:HEAT repeat protein